MNINFLEDFLKKDEYTQKFLSEIKEIKDIIVPQEYITIWNEVSLKVQQNKAKSHNLTTSQTQECFSNLRKRPYYLVSIAEQFGCKYFAEVGTAQGLQFFSFAEYAKKVNGHVWSCDIKDSRNEEYTKRYSANATFCLGDSKILASVVDKPIDMFYIDGAHDYGDVVRDVVNLKETQSEDPIWIFDDFDERFGCYKDIKRLCKMNGKFKIYRVGNAASGNPNHQVAVFGKF